MSKTTQKQQQSDVSEVLAAVLTSLPDDLPPEVRELFGRGLLEEGAALPPRLYQEAVEQMPVAISITDKDANILYINAAFTGLTGYEPTDIVGKNEAILSNQRTPKAVYVDLWKTIVSGNVWNGNLVNRRNDGGRYVAELTIVPVKTKTGDVRYYLGMHRDITEMHHLQRKVENQKNLIETILDSAPVVMALVDTSGKVILDNHAYKCLAADMRGIEPAEFFLKAFSGVLGDDLENACAEERTLSHMEVCLEPSNSNLARWFSCSAVWVREFELSADSYFDTHRQNALLIVCNEVTDLKRQYQDVRLNAVRANVAELEMSRYANELIEGAIHQLNGPLNVIQALSDMRRRRACEGLDMSLALDEALKSGRLAMDRLRMSLPPVTKEVLSPVNINNVIRDVLVLSSDRLSANGIVVDWRPDNDLPLVYGTENLLRILLKVVLDNAITAVGEPMAHGREVRVNAVPDDDGVIEISVRDSGPGIDRSETTKIFEPFYSRWSRRQRRAGMGLVVAQQIVGELGGDLRIDRHTPTGCTVRISLPTCRP